MTTAMINTAQLLWRYLLIFVVSYLLGSISFSIIISKLFFHDDIRNYGSGNAGMTNVLRTFGKGAAAATLLGDGAKGFISVQIARMIMSGLPMPDIADPTIYVKWGLYIAVAGALLGHLHPVYFQFKGGKGVSVATGALLAINPLQILIVAVIFLLTVFFSRIVSLASILAAAGYAVTTIVLFYVKGNVLLPDIIAAIIFPRVIIYAHRTNIKRLLNGTEYKFGQTKK